MVVGGRLVGLARAGAASQAGSDGGRTDEQEEIPPLDRHPDTLPRVRRVSHPTWPRPSDDGRRADPAFVGTGVLVMAAARPWRRVAEGRDQYLVGFGELKGVLQARPAASGSPSTSRAITPSKNAAATQTRVGPMSSRRGVGAAVAGWPAWAGGRLGRMPRICRLAPWPPGRVGCLPFGCAAEGQSLIIAVMSSPRSHMACCGTGSGRRDTRGRRRRAERRTGSGRKGRRRRGPPLLVNRAREAPSWPGLAASQSAGNSGSSPGPPTSEVPGLLRAGCSLLLRLAGGLLAGRRRSAGCRGNPPATAG
jgi:hypothetical protein